MDSEGEGPKWRLEHASNGRSICQQAACKRSKVKISTGELRIGTNTLFDNDLESRWYIAWRHWGCATKGQITGLMTTTENNATKVPGYDRLSAESQEQVLLAFEEGKPVDKEFKGVRVDLGKVAPRYSKEYCDAEGYQVSLGARAAACRGAECLSKNVKIVKGELRLGITVPFDGEHSSTVYKHWKCMSQYDLEQAKLQFDKDTFDGINMLSTEHQQVVIETFKTGKIVEPLSPEPVVPKVTKPRKKKEVIDEDSDDAGKATKARRKKRVADEEEYDGEGKAPKPKRTRKRRVIEESNASEGEYVPKQTKSREAHVEGVGPAVAKIQALTEQMREKAAH